MQENIFHVEPRLNNFMQGISFGFIQTVNIEILQPFFVERCSTFSVNVGLSGFLYD